MTSIKENINYFLDKIPSEVALIAISKTKPNGLIQEAYDIGHRDFGENKVQEMVDKAEQLPKDIRWHMVGHVQRNKVKYMAPFVHLIHGVDSMKLVRTLEKEGKKNERILHFLFQMHIGEEETKFGLDLTELEEILSSKEYAEMEYVCCQGLMGMATNTDDEAQIRKEFAQLNNLFNKYKEKHNWSTLSMGMSGDYELAIAEGSTMIRIGSSIFGSRE